MVILKEQLVEQLIQFNNLSFEDYYEMATLAHKKVEKFT